MHTIRLRGPWKAAWQLGADQQATYKRSFNCPTGLQAGQNVWISLEQVSDGPSAFNPAERTSQIESVILNGHTLWERAAGSPAGGATGDGGAVSLPVAEHLQAFNQLELHIGFSSSGRIASRDDSAVPPPRLTDLLSVALRIEE